MLFGTISLLMTMGVYQACPSNIAIFLELIGWDHVLLLEEKNTVSTIAFVVNVPSLDCSCQMCNHVGWDHVVEVGWPKSRPRGEVI